MLSSPLKIAEWLVFKSTSTSIVSTVPVPDLLVRRDKDSLGARSGSRTATGPGGDAGEEHRRKDAARPRVRGRTVQARTIPWAKGEEKKKRRSTGRTVESWTGLVGARNPKGQIIEARSFGA
jgi:hypothetical protein